MPRDATLPTQAMILAAGLGTRLRPITGHIPKCMVPIGGRPLLAYTLEWLGRHGITDVAVNLHHLPQVVMDYCGDGSRWGVRIMYSLEPEPLGTAGGVKNVAAFFRGPFFVWYGDNLSTCRLDRLWAFHRARHAVATIALYHRDDVTQSGIAELDRNDRVMRFVEKPTFDQAFSHWVNAGILVLEPCVLDAIPAHRVLDFGRDILPGLVAGGDPVYGYRMPADERLWWIDRVADLRTVERLWEGQGCACGGPTP